MIVKRGESSVKQDTLFQLTVSTRAALIYKYRNKSVKFVDILEIIRRLLRTFRISATI